MKSCLLLSLLRNQLAYVINRAAMGRARFLIYPWFIFFVGRLNQASLGQNSNDVTYDVQGQQKSQITKSRNLFKTLTSKRYTILALIVNVLTSLSERFDRNFRADKHFADGKLAY